MTGPDTDRARRRAAFAGIFVVTLLALLSVGAVLPVLPRYVKGPLGAGDVAVGVVIGAFAFTGLFGRPVAGLIADTRGRRPAIVLGSLLASTAGFLYFVPAGVPGLIVARLFLGAGEGMVFTAGATWVVDLAPPDRRARVIGLYGLAVWTGLSLGPPIGELLLHAFSYQVVWAFAAAAPLLGAVVAMRVHDQFTPAPSAQRGPLIAPESLRPGLVLALASVGYATMAAFVVLHLDAQGIGHGATVFGAFAAMVVLTRLIGGDLPDIVGPARCATVAASVEAAGLIMIAAAPSLAVALAGALAMGAAFSLLYPSLSLIVVGQVPETRRGAALGTFTAFFDAGVGLGAPVAGVVAATAGYGAAFVTASFAAAAAAITVAIALSARGRAMLAASRAR
ncbi:MAG: MFS transporter [Actinomycetota bacterium]